MPAPPGRVLDMTREVQLRISALDPSNLIGHGSLYRQSGCGSRYQNGIGYSETVTLLVEA